MTLLDGPRGRRLCLELARHADADVGGILFDLAYNAGVAAGAGIVRFGVNEDGSTFETRGAVTPRGTSADLAAGIRALGGLEVDGAELDVAMLRCVDSARYWEQPDGEDLVAAEPVVCDALTAIAGVLQRHPATQWWRRERTAAQWAIEFDPVADGAPFDAAPDAAARWSTGAREEEAQAAAERPADPNANWSGTWWSHPYGAPHSTGALPSGVPVGIPYIEDGFGWKRAVAIPVRGAGRTFEVRSGDDWARLCARYPLEVTASRRHDWYRTTGWIGRWVLPDWGRVAADWDAVHLTAWAYLTASTRAIAVDDECASVVAGWGPDETYWLTGLVRASDEPRVHWCADAPEGPWRRASAGV
ncbi:hypothetical protein [Microbacterium sp.]|uniref:hypothetical protein n=1 Tax=Microbacterium sp. TaxID=51671 RepID=UPI0039E442A4